MRASRGSAGTVNRASLRRRAIRGDGPLKRQFDQNHQFFLNLSDDRLLKIYRQRVGLPAPGENMGGWYDDFCPGAHFGQ
jgi:hypothetical protein